MAEGGDIGVSSARPGVVAIALVGAVLVGAPAAHANSPVQLNPPFPPTADVRDFRVSLDGATVVYVADPATDGQYELFSVPAGGGPATRLGGPVPITFFQFYEISPDSTRVVFHERPGTAGRLLSVPIGGGPATELASDFQSFQISPDSKHVVFTTGIPVRLFSVPITGGAAVELDGGPIAPFQVSPDSTRVVYNNGGRLMVVPLAGGPRLTLSQSVGTPDSMLITPDALRVVFKDGQSPAALHSVPITGGTATRLSPTGSGSDAVHEYAITADSSWTVFAWGPTPFSVETWAAPTAGGTPRRVSPQPTNANQTVSGFAVAPDSTRVLTRFGDGLTNALHAGALTSGATIELAPAVRAGSFSATSSHAVYVDPADNNELKSVPLGGGAPTKLSTTSLGVASFDVSPGGSKVAYSGSLVRVPVGGGAATTVDSSAGALRWSPTGAHVVYTKGTDLFSWADPAGADAAGGPPPPPPGPGPGPGPGPAGTQVGLVDPSQGRWHLRDNAGQLTSFFFGNPGDVPVMGDWDCDGVDTPGLFRTSDAFAYLSNANRSQIADIRFFFGDPADLPLAGDFDGDGCDTLSIYRPSEGRFYIVNELGENEGGLGAADFSFGFGDLGDKPVVGDWDGDGVDEIGLHRESTGLFYWRNTLSTGIADGSIIFGDPGDRFVAGDWGLVDGRATPGLFRPSATTFFFRHTLTQGNADAQFQLGQSPWLPVAGNFGL